MNSENLSIYEPLLDVPVPVSIRVGSTRCAVKAARSLQAGGVILLDSGPTTPVCIYANRKLIARGEFGFAEGRLGVKITELVSTAEENT